MAESILRTVPRPLWSDEQTKAPHTEYTIEVNYIVSGGILQVPVSPTKYEDLRQGVPPPAPQPGKIVNLQPIQPPSRSQTTCQFIQTALPTARKIVTWSAVRLGKKPAIPLPYPRDSSSNLVLLGTSVSPLPPTLSADGLTRIYRAAGVYVYGMKNPLLPGDTHPSARPPYEEVSWQEASILPQDWDQNILFQ